MTDDEVDALNERFGDLNARLSALSLIVKVLARSIDEAAPGASDRVREQIQSVLAEAGQQSSPERRQAVATVAADALRVLSGI